jgi:lipid-binding SYLF domain-containing protein
VAAAEAKIRASASNHDGTHDSADILAFSRAKGLYGGIALDGAVVATRGEWNDAYYGKRVTPTDILIRREVSNPQAVALIDDLSKSACSTAKC